MTRFMLKLLLWVFYIVPASMIFVLVVSFAISCVVNKVKTLTSRKRKAKESRSHKWAEGK